MSFDIYYQTCNLGTGTARRKNPFTGAIESVPIDDGLSVSERAAVETLLRSSGATGPDQFGCYVLDLPDGGSAEVFARGLGGAEPFDGLMVAARSLTLGLASFLWELCRAGNMVAMPVMEEEVAAVASEAQRARVQSRWPEAVVVGSASEFSHLLNGGFAAWQSYRDQVARPQ